MKIPIYHVDAFSETVFSGNPAAVCILSEWLPEPQLQMIAAENLLPVTAFLKLESNGYSTRWFTPENELPLCGHGSLASGLIIFHYLQPEKTHIELHSQHSGTLTLSLAQGAIQLEFPSKPPSPHPIPDILPKALGAPVKEFHAYHQERCLILLEDEDTVRKLKPNLQELEQLSYKGFVVTAPGKVRDFVSRTFYPGKIMFPEDPVTGASHCMLMPYWAEKLGKNALTAQQLSPRGGYLSCELRGDTVIISGHAALYSEGLISI